MEETTSPAIRLRGDAWTAWTTRHRLAGVDAQAEHLGISRAQLYKVLNGSVAPGERFIAAVVAAGGRFEQLFEVVS